MKHDDELLNAVLGGTEADRLRSRSRDVGLAAIRTRRRARRVAGAMLALVPVAAACVFLAVQTIPKRANIAGVALPPQPVPEMPQSAVEVIDDDDLLALFPNRPVALIGTPGKQQLIFLDERGSQL